MVNGGFGADLPVPSMSTTLLQAALSKHRRQGSSVVSRCRLECLCGTPTRLVGGGGPVEQLSVCQVVRRVDAGLRMSRYAGKQ
jgi:hypothetical protein